MDKFVVTSSPFIRSSNDINKMFLYTIIALLLPTVYGCIFFGLKSMLVVLLLILVCFLSECLFNLFAIKKFFVENLSFMVTALTLALSMPVDMPLYIIGICGFVSVFFVKQVFGGLGKNKFNPSIVGRLLAGIMVSFLGKNLYEITINGEVYTSFTSGGTNSIMNLLTGKAVGGIGTTCIIVMLVSFVILVYMSVIDWKIPVLSVLAYFVTFYIMKGIEPAVLNICSGSFIFVSIFMITDPNTSPNTLIGKIIYSILFGSLSAVLWNMGKMGEETIFAVALFVDILVPFMDKYLIIRKQPLGGYRNAHKN